MVEMLESDAGVSEDCLEADIQGLTHLEVAVRSWVSGRVRNLRLLWRNGGLELQGETRTYYVKQLAQHAVMKLTSYRIVANGIVVDRSCHP